MKKKNLLLSLSVPASLMLIFVIGSCGDDEKPRTLPQVTTIAATSITPTTAVAGGEIDDDGNARITAAGIVYSHTNNTPTIDDSKADATIENDAFSTELSALSSGTSYYIRAYATNSKGTAYGEVLSFTTGNAAPTATNVSITGDPEVNKPLTATYTYSDAEGDAQGATSVRWYIADNVSGSGETLISSATELIYIPDDINEFKYVAIEIVPKATAGTTDGVAVKSAYVGPIAVRTTITFTYNNQQVTYGIITSPVTGRKWLDRNLGAPNKPTSYDDFANYGDLIQWGRAADGHQLVNRTASTANTTGTATTTELATTDNPTHAFFIVNLTSPYDWRNPLNSNLWQGVNGTNNPCPTGFRIPTIDEWAGETLTNVISGYTKLNLTLGGLRGVDGPFYTVEGIGHYWSSTVLPGSTRSRYISFDTFSESPEVFSDGRSSGKMCRCIKD